MFFFFFFKSPYHSLLVFLNPLFRTLLRLILIMINDTVDIYLTFQCIITGIIKNGGAKPNIIPELTELEFYARTPTKKELQTLIEKLENCFKSAAIATGCRVCSEIQAFFFVRFSSIPLFLVLPHVATNDSLSPKRFAFYDSLRREYVYRITVYQKYLSRLGELIIFEPCLFFFQHLTC